VSKITNCETHVPQCQAVSINFADATLVSAFVARWCATSKVETRRCVPGQEDEPVPRVGAAWHRIP
jgi:hypothetical protein